MLIDRPRLQVLVGNRDVTDRCDSLVFSATDNGGFEIATLGLPSTDRPLKGAAITIRQGLEVAWSGRVAEIADHSQHGRATKTTGCEGWRALLRDTNVSMVYADRDLTRWSAPSVTRQAAIVQASQLLAQSQAASDPVTGNPALIQTISGDWVAPYIVLAEAWYDAGPGNLISRIWYDVTSPSTNPQWHEQVIFSADMNMTVTQGTVDLHGGTRMTGYFLTTNKYRYGALQHYYGGTPGGTPGAGYSMAWNNLTMYGNHGLALRGPDPGGFYPSDVARHAVSQCAGVLPGRIDDSTGYIAPHVVYRTPTPVDTIIDDMAKLVGWTWGVWEPPTIFSTQPRLDFRPPPTDATAVVLKAECDQLDITSRLGDLYNVCQVSYTDPAAGLGIATVTLPNAQLAQTGIATRTLQLSLGVGTPASAAAFGQIALALSQVAARAAGQATLPISVRLPGGGSKPACLLRPGIDRLRIVDLIDGGPLLDIGTVRRDVFRISRVETTVGKDGVPATRVELDSGSNLLETLQARLAVAAGVIGAGASGG